MRFGSSFSSPYIYADCSVGKSPYHSIHSAIIFFYIFSLRYLFFLKNSIACAIIDFHKPRNRYHFGCSIIIQEFSSPTFRPPPPLHHHQNLTNFTFLPIFLLQSKSREWVRLLTPAAPARSASQPR